MIMIKIRSINRNESNGDTIIIVKMIIIIVPIIYFFNVIITIITNFHINVFVKSIT